MSHSKIRVRFAPSPTGPLHIGGVRTALYNYLFAKKHGGTFILRIEDTDQGRYVKGAEDYIVESLKWCGFEFDEGPGIGGDYGPYRQSERKAMYAQFAKQLVDNGHAYYAFDTPEELDAKRKAEAANGNHNFRYDNQTRSEMVNSTTLSAEETESRLAAGDHYVIRFKMPKDEVVSFTDAVRGEVSFQTNELDDKVLLKGDGMPTYHMANIVDDYHMKITNVIRGEEWLSSTGLHVLLYKGLGWENDMPQFAHLPLILKPVGSGKLSKRDGAKFNMPVFPLRWDAPDPKDRFLGFKEFGFLPEATINFLAFLGWNPGTEQEIFSLDELCEAFSIEKISKSGARFDYDKARWFNQQYLQNLSAEELAKMVAPIASEKEYDVSEDFLVKYCELMKDRVATLPEFFSEAPYFFHGVESYDEKNVLKRWKPESRAHFETLISSIESMELFDATSVETGVKNLIKEQDWKMGAILPMLRIGLAGTMKGPDVFKMIALLGKSETLERLRSALDVFDKMTNNG